MDDIQSGIVKAAVSLIIFAESMGLVFLAEKLLCLHETGLSKMMAEGVFYG